MWKWRCLPSFLPGTNQQAKWCMVSQHWGGGDKRVNSTSSWLQTKFKAHCATWGSVSKLHTVSPARSLCKVTGEVLEMTKAVLWGDYPFLAPRALELAFLRFNCSVCFLRLWLLNCSWFASKEPYLTEIYLAMFSISQSLGTMSFTSPHNNEKGHTGSCDFPALRETGQHSLRVSWLTTLPGCSPSTGRWSEWTPQRQWPWFFSVTLFDGSNAVELIKVLIQLVSLTNKEKASISIYLFRNLKKSLLILKSSLQKLTGIWN